MNTIETESLVALRDEYVKIAKKRKKRRSKDQRTFPISRALKNEKFMGGYQALAGGLTGAGAGGALGGAKGALIGGAGGALSTGILNAIRSRALLGRARKNQKGIGGSEKKIIKALRATKSGRKGPSNPISRALTSVPGMAALGAAPGAIIAGIALSGGVKKKELLKTLLGGTGLAAGGAATMGGAAALSRVLNARGLRGENRVGRKRSYSQGLGLFEGDTAQTRILKALRKAGD